MSNTNNNTNDNTIINTTGKTNDDINIKQAENTDEGVRKQAIKYENKKAFKRFIGIIIVGAVVGGFIGFLSNFLTNYGTLSPAEALQQALYTITPFMLPLILIVCGGFMLLFYLRAKKLYASCNSEDEYVMNDVEINISKSMIATSVGSIVGLFFLGIQIFNMMEGIRTTGDDTPDSVFLVRLLIMLGFIVLMFVFVFCQKKIIDFNKLMNPEKKGSAYDLKFQDVWLQSCDEAEKMRAYRSAYASYKFMNIFLIVLWAISMTLAISLGTGLLAMTFASASWLALNLSYSLKAMKLKR